MPFHDMLGAGYLALMKQRLRGEREVLVWPRQVRDLLRPHLQKGTLLLEVGCCVGTAYQAFEGTGISYIGLDNEPKYLAVAKQWYGSDPRATFVEHDFTKRPLPAAPDIVICSATLEHCLGFQPGLKYLAEGAGHILVLRTFLGHQEQIAYRITATGERFHVNRYAFRDVLGYLAGKGFAVKVHRDRHTDSIPQFLDGWMRTFYVIFAERVAR